MALEIRLLREEEYKAVVDFYNSSISVNHKIQRDKRTYEAFKWEFFNGPYGKAIYVVAIDTDYKDELKLVGIQCAIPIVMHNSKGEKFYTAKSEDVYIDIRSQIKFKNRDVLKEMTNLLIEECESRDIKFIWGLTDVISSFKRVGWEVPISSIHGLMIMNPSKAYKYLASKNINNKGVDKIKIFALCILSMIYGWKRIFVFKKLDSIKQLLNKQSNINLFYKATENEISIMQTEEYLKWRIEDNPSNVSYKIIQFTDETNELVAEVIYSFANDIFYIDQMLFDKKLNEKVRVKIIRTILNEIISKHNVSIIRFAGFRHNKINREEIHYLKNLGFFFVNKGIFMVTKKLGNYELDYANLFVSRLFTQGIVN